MPVLVTNCSNNYGPRQFPEKLIPLMIVNALAGKPLPVYGDGQQIRDWLYVGDHCSAIRRVLGRASRRALPDRRRRRETQLVVKTICRLIASTYRARLRAADHPTSPTGRDMTAVTPSTSQTGA